MQDTLKPINISATERERREWRIQAAIEGRAVSQMVRQAVREYVDRTKEREEASAYL